MSEYLQRILDSKPIESSDHDYELHFLTGGKHIPYMLWAYKSFVYFSERKWKVFIHSDSSCNKEDRKNLDYHVPGHVFISSSEAKRQICKDFQQTYENIHFFRCIKNKVLFKKLIDFHYFSHSKSWVGIDTDILFMKKPTHMLDLVDKNKGFYTRDAQNAYCFRPAIIKEVYNINLEHKINSGIVSVPSDNAYKINFLENIAFIRRRHVEDKLLGRGGWVEQTLFATMFSNFKYFYECLDEKEYVIPKSIEEDYDKTSVHCVTPKRLLFEQFLQKNWKLFNDLF